MHEAFQAEIKAKALTHKTEVRQRCLQVDPAPLKLRPYGAIQMCILLLLLLLLSEARLETEDQGAETEATSLLCGRLVWKTVSKVTAQITKMICVLAIACTSKCLSQSPHCRRQ